MKKILALIFILLNASLAVSQGYDLNVKLKDGTSVVYNVADISKMDFVGISSGIEDLEKFQQVVKTIKLLQNYPNPFNPSTTINYELANAGDIEVIVYDINGRLVRKLVDQFQSAGVYEIVWDGMDKLGNKSSSGVYIYAVKQGNKISTKKMILLK